MKLLFRAEGCIPLADVLENVRLSKLRGLREPAGNGKRLALVGGGPSAADHVETLRNWPGEVWAINGAARWCWERGIKATLVTFHPWVEVPECVTRIILGEECSPALFDACAGRELYVLNDETPSGQVLPRGGTTATAVAIKFPFLGFFDVTLFGLEGSYSGHVTHNYTVYEDPNEPWVIVEANGQTFRTKAEFLLQGRWLAEFIHAYPIYEERSGGLLAALVKDHDYDVIDMAPCLRAKLDPEEQGNGAAALDYSPQSAA